MLQNFRCIIYILAEEVGTHHNRNEDEFRCRKENSYHFVDSLFVTLKMHKHNIYFAQRWDCVQRFKRNKKSPLYFLLRGWKAPNIVWNIIIGRHELAISLTTIHLVVRYSLSKNWETDPFWVGADGLCYLNLTIWTRSHTWGYIWKKTRIMIRKHRRTSFCHLSLIKIKRKQWFLFKHFN